MDVGLVQAIRFLPGRPERLAHTYRNFVDEAVLAEDLGLDFVWTTEHHFAADGWMPAQLPVLSFIAARTSRLQLGTCLFLLPFHNPLRVAEDVATIDLLSNGRFTGFACGSGSDAGEFESYGLDPKERWGRLFEGLRFIREAFAREQYDHHGKYFQFPNVRMTTKPVQNPFPLWVGGFGPKLLERAGREGYHLQGGREGIQTYMDGLESSGYDEHDFNYQVFYPGHLGATRDQAWDAAQEGVYWYRDFYTTGRSITGTKRYVPPSPDDLRKETNPPELVGTPEDVLRRLEPQLKDSRVTHFGLLHRLAGMSTEVSRTSLDLYAKEVMPVLKTWGRQPVSGMGARRSATA
ncbi:MAG: LLM class flavin-dependent oxidoreductase [Chloroflexi bacterium]|nr:LLM class flavin-dependent oxidoreductase [Chloroflexota bacterium]